MAIPRFKPDYVWTDKDWANLPIKGCDLAEKLTDAGFTVLGVTNKRPTLQEKINTNELQLLVEKLLRGETSLTPRPISRAVPKEEPKPAKKKGR